MTNDLINGAHGGIDIGGRWSQNQYQSSIPGGPANGGPRRTAGGRKGDRVAGTERGSIGTNDRGWWRIERDVERGQCARTT
ncbi:hypothetical protein, partial [Spirosoma harenae]